MESQMQLIIILPNNKIDLYEKFILRLNLIKERLTVLPPKEEGKSRFKPFHITFKRNYIHQNIFQRIICVDECETDSKKYVLIFNTVEKCLNFIESVKNSKAKDKLLINVSSNDEIFKSRFLIPVLKIAARDDVLNELLQSILLEIHQFYKPTSAAVKEDENVPQSENDETVMKDQENEPSNRNNTSNIGHQNDGGSCVRRRSFRTKTNIISYEENENIEDKRTSKRSNPARSHRESEPSNKKPKTAPMHDIIYAPNFEIIKFARNGISKSRLFIFPSSNKEMCYEYSYYPKLKRYVCCGCSLKRKYINTTVKKDSNGIDYVQCQQNSHICEPRKFEPEKFQSDIIIKKPNYDIIEEKSKGKSKKYLILYTSTDKKNFYKLTYFNRIKCYLCTKCDHPYLKDKRKYINAFIKYDENGNEFVSVRNLKHACSEMEYVKVKENTPLNSPHIQKRKVCERQKKHVKKNGNVLQKTPSQISTKSQINDKLKIIHKPNYRKFQRNTNKKIIEKLAVFVSTDSTMCYKYTWSNAKQYYECHTCKNKHDKAVYATIVKNGNNEEEEEYVQLSKHDHVCKLQKF